MLPVPKFSYIMSKTLLLLLVVATISSCNTWSEETRQTWQQACADNAINWAASKDEAQTYCNCVMEKMMTKYPDVNDALDHVSDLATDTAFYACRQGIKLK